ncbi:MAG TPA: hypothetical protein VNO50_19480 [Pyrinomonadaceae bacterium]|nr:hypothetical protein [Pyrinomonadaceae bacterium]
MSYRNFLISVTAMVLLFTFPAKSQQSLRGLDEEAAAAVRKKAIALLESVATQVDGLRSAENRARIGSNLGALLWTHDEKRARSLFAAVEQDIKAGFLDTDTDPETGNHTLMVFWQLRKDTLERIAQHDPDFALEFLRTTQPPAHIQLPYNLQDAEKSLELRLASQIVAKNPALALKLGRQSLAKGFSPELSTSLSRLRWKDRAATMSLAEAIVDKLKTANLAQDEGAIDIALYIAHSFEPPEVAEQTYRELLGLLAGAMTNNCSEEETQNAPYICFRIGSVFSKLEGYFGQRAISLRRFARDEPKEAVREMPPQVREIVENGTINEMLALAVKHPDLQQQLYWKAMMKAQASGDVTLARKIASEISDEELRGYMLGHIDREKDARSADPTKLSAIQQELSRLPNNDERIQFLLERAFYIGGNDRKAALGLLSQAGQILDSTKSGRAQLEGQIVLAMMYCSLKSDRGFAIMEWLIPKFNELVAASATLDGFGHDYIRDGEWNMSGEGEVGRLLNAVAENAGFFAAQDFDRSVNLAGQMERPELRLMAKLKIAQGVLASQPNAARMFHSPAFAR